MPAGGYRLKRGGWFPWLAVAVGVSVFGIRTLPALLLGFVTSPRPGDPGYRQAAERWSNRPPEQWPTLVMVNAGMLRDRPLIARGTGFLVQSRQGETLGATGADVLVRPAPQPAAAPKLEDAAEIRLEEDEPTVGTPGADLEAFRAAFVSWQMKPAKAVSSAGVSFRRVHGTLAAYQHTRALLLDNAGTPLPENLPATALTVRDSPVYPGHRVFVVVADPDHGQTIRAGKILVVERLHGRVFALTLDAPIPSENLPGAPVLDASGHLVGVATIAANGASQGDVRAVLAEGVPNFSALLE